MFYGLKISNKKFCRFLSIPKRQVVEFAREVVFKGQFGVNRICNLVGISKTTYYSARNPVDIFEKKRLNIKGLVSRVIEQNSSYGIKRIKAELEEKYHVNVGRDTLGRLSNPWTPTNDHGQKSFFGRSKDKSKAEIAEIGIF